VPDDVSDYKFITMRVFAKGPKDIRVELIPAGRVPSRSGVSDDELPGFSGFSILTNSSSTPQSAQWAIATRLNRDVLRS